MARTRTLFAASLVLLIAAPAAICQGNGSIAGTVAGDDNRAVAAVVTARSNAPGGAGFRARAAADGKFTIPNLPAGAYTLCAVAEPPGYVDPCEWSVQPLTVQLAEGQAATGAALVVKKGGALRVRLNDPDKVLGQTPAPNQAAAGVLLGVFTPRRLFRVLPLANTDANGRDFELTIPLDDTPAFLYVAGHGVRVFEPSGGQIGPNGKQISIAPRNGKAPSLMTFTVRAE